jgi:nuclear transcription factor Y, gamma
MDPNQYPRPSQPGPAQIPASAPPFPYDPTASGGHFGAASMVAQSGYVPATAQYNNVFSNVTQGLQGTYRNVLATYWQHVIYEIENEEHDFKVHQLPLARIKVYFYLTKVKPIESHEIR